MRIAAIVVTYNRPQLLQQVVAALHAQSRAVDRIFIVDNGSDDATRALAAQLGDVVVVRSDTNVGGAGGFALGLEHAHAAGFDWIWLLDDDAIPRPQALHQLEQAVLGAAGGAGAVCGAVNEFGDLALAHRRTFSAWTGLETCVPRRAYQHQPTPIGTGSFVGFMVAACAVARVGPPERGFFVAYDDTDYSLRLGQAGLAVWLVPTSIVDHMRTAQSRLRAGPFGRKHYFNIRNRIIVLRRHAALPLLPGAGATLIGVALWLACPGRFRPYSIKILLQAIMDGWAGRLGPYPAPLERFETGSSEEEFPATGVAPTRIVEAPPVPPRSGKTPSG